MEFCGWAVDYGECGDCEPLAGLPASGVERFERMAAEYLWRWTGRRFGQCEVTVRPCRQDCYEGPGAYFGPLGAQWTPALIRGQWYNIGCGRCGDSCGCDTAQVLRLPGPVAEVTEVQVNGVALPSDSYRVDNHRILVNTGTTEWPTCQDMGADLGEANTWGITYLRGTPVPVGGQIAAGVLACELAKAACRDKSCALPQRVQTISRQGVTVAMLDSFDDIDKGHTGIWIIDSWIASVTKPLRGGTVRSPDVPSPRMRRTTWQ